jgi:hypothetical protein
LGDTEGPWGRPAIREGQKPEDAINVLGSPAQDLKGSMSRPAGA